MHAETLAYLFHNLPYDDKRSPALSQRPAGRAVQPVMIEIPAGDATLGQKRGEFGWDNEFAEHHVHVPAFTIGKYKITNGQYLDFVRDGAPAPHFWTERAAQWFYRGMFGEVPLPLNAPVYVTHSGSSQLRTLGG